MIIAVTNRSLCEDNFIQRVRNLIDSGVYGVYLREKDLNQKDYETLALKISEGSKKYLSRFILCNPDSAKIIGVQNIQVSMEFVKNNEAPPVGLRTGVSVHSIDEAITAERWGADYITAGHIFVKKRNESYFKNRYSTVCYHCTIHRIQSFFHFGLFCQKKKRKDRPC